MKSRASEFHTMLSFITPTSPTSTDQCEGPVVFLIVSFTLHLSIFHCRQRKAFVAESSTSRERGQEGVRHVPLP